MVQLRKKKPKNVLVLYKPPDKRNRSWIGGLTCVNHVDDLLINPYIELDRLEQWLRSKIKVDIKTKCWMWQGNTNRQGYGIARLRMKTTGVNRIAYVVFKRKPLGELFALHRCDVPGCINPKHLFSGTGSTNMLDCSSKGRLTDNSGESNGRAVLNENDVREIRQLALSKSVNQIAALFCISSSHVKAIIAKKYWKCVI